MGFIKKAGDLVYTFRFLALLVTPFEKTKAFELGLIDKDGKRTKTPGDLDYPEQRDAYTPFIRLVFNIKRLMAKAPGGQSVVARYAAALYLIKENLELSDKSIKQITEKCGLDPLDFLSEQSGWFLLESGALAPGSYRVKNNKIVNSTFEEVVRPRDWIRVGNDCYPVGEMFGLNVYEATHVNTRQKVYITIGEIMS